MGCFAGLEVLLHILGAPLLLPKASPVEPGSLADSLLWHLLDAIPGIKVPETIKSRRRCATSAPARGGCFSSSVIVPVVSGIGRYLKEERRNLWSRPRAAWSRSPLRLSVSGPPAPSTSVRFQRQNLDRDDGVLDRVGECPKASCCTDVGRDRYAREYVPRSEGLEPAENRRTCLRKMTAGCNLFTA
jgi:hypothetical protein